MRTCQSWGTGSLCTQSPMACPWSRAAASRRGFWEGCCSRGRRQRLTQRSKRMGWQREIPYCVSCGFAMSGISCWEEKRNLRSSAQGRGERGRGGKKGVRDGCQITGGGAPCPLELGAHSRESRNHDKHPRQALPQPSLRACKGKYTACKTPHRANHVGNQYPRGGVRWGG